MFVDHAKIEVHGGRGGRGCASFHCTKYNRHGSPDGGNGGSGGTVLVRADRNLATLCDFIYQPISHAGDGGNGGNNKKHGRTGKDLVLRVPVGTIVRDGRSDATLADLKEDGAELVVANGGKGGFGNVHFKSSTNRSPRYAEPGDVGEHRRLDLELKIVADIGIIGFPNAGKSTLIMAITRAHSKIASYPFTTLQPVLGLLELPDYTTTVIADMPGIVEGAHRNVGLGHAFLKHIERTCILLVLLDMAGVDQRDPGDDYDVLMDELERYDAELAARPRLVVANKMDVEGAAKNLAAFKRTHRGVKVTQISALDGLGLDEVRQRIHELLERHGHRGRG